MVKNVHGGNKSKGMARKGFVKRESALRVAEEEGEIYAQAVKVMGGSIASAIDLNGNPLRVHIRGKFRGKGKRDNFIAAGTWMLVGLHSWESSSNKSEIRNCDVLEVYKETDKNRLKNAVTSVDFGRFVSNDTKTIGEKEEDDATGIQFTDEVTEEYNELFTNANTNANITIVMEDGDMIDVNDI